MAGVLQGKENGAVADLLVQGNGDAGDGAVIAHNLQGTVNGKGSGAVILAVFAGDGDLLIAGSFGIGDGDGGQTVAERDHLTGFLGAVGKGDGHIGADAQRLLHLKGHKAVQGNQHQSTVFINGPGYGVLLLRVDLFDPAGGGGLDAGGRNGIFRLGQVAVQLLNHGLQLRNCGIYLGFADRCQNIAGGDLIAVFHMVGIQLQNLRNADRLGLRRGQGAGAGEHGGDGVELRGAGENSGVYGYGIRRGGGQGGDNHGDGQDQADARNPVTPVSGPGRGVRIKLQRRHGVFRGLRHRLLLSRADCQNQKQNKAQSADRANGNPVTGECISGSIRREGHPGGIPGQPGKIPGIRGEVPGRLRGSGGCGLKCQIRCQNQSKQYRQNNQNQSFLIHCCLLNRRNAGRRWAAFWPLCWPDTDRKSRR